MNNSKIAIDSVPLTLEEPQVTPAYEQREKVLIRLIESLNEVQATKGWSSLKKDLFDTLPESLNKQILLEAKQQTPNSQKLARLSGELKWAEQFADLGKLSEQFRVELQRIRQHLYGTSQKDTR